MHRIVGLALALLGGIQGKDSTVLAKVPDGALVVENSLRFARNGSKVAFVIRKGAKFRPVVDGTVGDEYDEVSAPVMDATGQHVAFRAMLLEHNKSARWILLYDGKSIASDDWIGEVALAPNDGTPAFWLSHGHVNNADGSLSHGPMTLQFGKLKSKKWQGTEEQIPPCFTADGKWVFSVGTRGGDSNVVALDNKGKEVKYGQGLIAEAVVSADGKEYACSSIDYSKGDPKIARAYVFAVWREEVAPGPDALPEHASRGYASAGSPVFSPSGRELAYKIERGGQFGVVTNGSMDARYEFDFVDEICWSPDNGSVAYLAGRGCKLNDHSGTEILAGTRATGGKWIAVHGDERSSEYDAAREPRCSRDGKQFAYAACLEDKWRLVVGAKSSDACDDVAGLVWADDGKSVSYGCRQGDEITWRKLALE